VPDAARYRCKVTGGVGTGSEIFTLVVVRAVVWNDVIINIYYPMVPTTTSSGCFVVFLSRAKRLLHFLPLPATLFIMFGDTQ
jgi:hypothetical protein